MDNTITTIFNTVSNMYPNILIVYDDIKYDDNIRMYEVFNKQIQKKLFNFWLIIYETETKIKIVSKHKSLNFILYRDGGAKINHLINCINKLSNKIVAGYKQFKKIYRLSHMTRTLDNLYINEDIYIMIEDDMYGLYFYGHIIYNETLDGLLKDYRLQSYKKSIYFRIL
jgi:hypothetical protein